MRVSVFNIHSTAHDEEGAYVKVAIPNSNHAASRVCVLT